MIPNHPSITYQNIFLKNRPTDLRTFPPRAEGVGGEREHVRGRGLWGRDGDVALVLHQEARRHATGLGGGVEWGYFFASKVVLGF